MSKRRYAPGRPAMLALALTEEQAEHYVGEYMSGRMSTRMMLPVLKRVPGLEDLKRQDIWAWLNERLENGPE